RLTLRRYEKFALMRVFFDESFFEHPPQRIAAQVAPRPPAADAGRRLARDAFDGDVGPQAAQDFGRQVDVFGGRPAAEPRGLRVVEVGHARPLDELQLVELDR